MLVVEKVVVDAVVDVVVVALVELLEVNVLVVVVDTGEIVTLSWSSSANMLLLGVESGSFASDALTSAILVKTSLVITLPEIVSVAKSLISSVPTDQLGAVNAP